MFCSRCKYDLRGLADHRCPECGRPFNPSDPRSYLSSIAPWWHSRYTWLLVIPAIVLIGGVLSVPLVEFHYPRVVNNDPLISPVEVSHVEGNTIILADDRRFTVHLSDEPLDQVVKNSGYQIDLESWGPETAIFVKRQGWICGTPWARRLFRIPLIPDDVPINHRQLIGIGVPEGD